ncbi:MAG TPA: hypothetical protein DCE43_14760 [Planctomycetaceae bacterium]|nr:hypothetical protein [Planctomycetaceae bacterium]HCK53995.1 hypothetical protein [Planctomycetaceae bacterium]|tara:strand:- start:4133 stop:4528 length:396 start_codon:yes stop_codon:yes gene_type:complete
MPPRNELGREAVSALATAMVTVGGTIVLVFIIIVGSDDPEPYLAGVAITVTITCLLLFLLRSRPENSTVKKRPWWRAFRRGPVRSKPPIVVQRRNESDMSPDTKQPPTAEQLRDIKQHGSTWVPNRIANRR